MNKYQVFYQKMLNGEIPFKEKFFCIPDRKKGNEYSDAKNKIKIISPTQSSVDQAKSELEDKKDINKNEELDLNQFGGSSKGGKKKKAKPKKSKKTAKKKTTKTKGGVKKTKRKTKKKKTTKKSDSKWISFKTH